MKVRKKDKKEIIRSERLISKVADSILESIGREEYLGVRDILVTGLTGKSTNELKLLLKIYTC